MTGGAGEAVADEGLVDEEAVASSEGVGEQAAVVVAQLRVALEADLGARRYEVSKAAGRLAPEALDRLGGMHRLGGVDADEADRLTAAACEPEAQRVAVDDLDDDADVGRQGALGRTPSAAGGDECEQADEQMSDARGHGLPHHRSSGRTGGRSAAASRG